MRTIQLNNVLSQAIATRREDNNENEKNTLHTHRIHNQTNKQNARI